MPVTPGNARAFGRRPAGNASRDPSSAGEFRGNNEEPEATGGRSLIADRATVGGEHGRGCCVSTVWVGWPATREADALTRPRMLLGTRLRQLRERCGLTLGAAAAAIGSPARLEAMERGVTRSEPRVVIALAETYGVTDHATRVALLELARLSHRDGWWTSYRRVIRSWFLPYLGAEQAAQVIRCSAREFVPDLLQHTDYARSMIRQRHPGAGAEEIDLRLRLRLRRQQIIHAEDPAHLWVILDEAAICRHVAGPSTMFRQLSHLLDLCDLPNVTIQVARSADVSLSSPLTLVQLPERDIRHVVFLQQLDSALYPEQPDFHRHAMNALAVRARPPADTPDILCEMITSL